MDFKNDFKMESAKEIYCNFDVALDIWTIVFRSGKTSSNMEVISKILWENQKQAVAVKDKTQDSSSVKMKTDISFWDHL